MIIYHSVTSENIHEWSLGKDFEADSRGLLESSIPAIACKY